MSENIILTTGIYDAIKEHLRRRKVSIEEEKRLQTELKGRKRQPNVWRQQQLARSDLVSD